MVKKVMVKTGVSVNSQAMMYKAFIQKVLLYGSEIRVVMDAMMKVLEGLNHRIDRQIAG